MHKAHSLLLLPLAAAFMACGSKSTGPGDSNGEFVVRGSGSVTASSLSQLNVDPSVFSVAFFEIRLSSNTDCSGPYVSVLTASPARRLDMKTNPEIVRVAGLPDGTYPCLAMRISDLLQFVPATTEGVCIGGTSYTHDTYRVGNESVAFKDINGAPITAHGTDAAPAEDPVWAFASTNPSAVEARGYSQNQIITLSASLHVPGSTTFYWDATNALQSTGSECDIVAGNVGFR
ncbi:MAG: hypothetical protein ABI542_01060 [Gemmatimonadota bacterium]